MTSTRGNVSGRCGTVHKDCNNNKKDFLADCMAVTSLYSSTVVSVVSESRYVAALKIRVNKSFVVRS